MSANLLTSYILHNLIMKPNLTHISVTLSHTDFVSMQLSQFSSRTGHPPRKTPWKFLLRSLGHIVVPLYASIAPCRQHVCLFFVLFFMPLFPEVSNIHWPRHEDIGTLMFVVLFWKANNSEHKSVCYKQI